VLTILAAGAILSSAAEPEIPFTFSEGLIWVQGRAENTPEPLNFLLDSGATVSVVNLQTAKKLGLKSGKAVTVRGVSGNTTGYWPQRLKASAAQVELPKKWLVVDLGSLSGACQCSVDGLIGADFFNGRIVEVDFETSRIRLLRRSIHTGDAVPLKTKGGGLHAGVSVNGGRLQWLRLDTGCASSLQWVTGEPMIAAEEKLAVALTQIPIKVGATRVRLGNTTFPNVPTGIHEQSIFRGEDGLLGNGLLSRFRSFTVDAKAGWLLLGELAN
jgi:hypothetical protein